MVMMSVWPTDAADGSVSSEARWRKMGRVWTPSGVIRGAGGAMAPTLAGVNLTVQSGACWVDGHYCELAGSQVLAVTANGLVVVRFDPAANTAELLYRDGVTVPAQNPTGVFELGIAAVVGSALVDWRTRWADGTTVVTATGQPNPSGAPLMNDAAYGAALAARAMYLPAVASLTGGWGSGLRQIGAIPIPAVPATFPGPFGNLIHCDYVCVGAAGSGAPLAGTTVRTRFRLAPGVDQGISYLRTATSDQQVINDSLSWSRAPGSPASNVEIWAETTGSCNISGSAFLIASGGGGLT